MPHPSGRRRKRRLIGSRVRAGRRERVGEREPVGDHPPVLHEQPRPAERDRAGQPPAAPEQRDEPPLVERAVDDLDRRRRRRRARRPGSSRRTGRTTRTGSARTARPRRRARAAAPPAATPCSVALVQCSSRIIVSPNAGLGQRATSPAATTPGAASNVASHTTPLSSVRPEPSSQSVLGATPTPTTTTSASTDGAVVEQDPFDALGTFEPRDPDAGAQVDAVVAVQRREGVAERGPEPADHRRRQRLEHGDLQPASAARRRDLGADEPRADHHHRWRVRRGRRASRPASSSVRSTWMPARSGVSRQPARRRAGRDHRTVVREHLAVVDRDRARAACRARSPAPRAGGRGRGRRRAGGAARGRRRRSRPARKSFESGGRSYGRCGSAPTRVSGAVEPEPAQLLGRAQAGERRTHHHDATQRRRVLGGGHRGTVPRRAPPRLSVMRPTRLSHNGNGEKPDSGVMLSRPHRGNTDPEP